MQSKDVSMLQVTCLGNCDMMKQVSAHFTSVSRITGHHVEDLRACLAAVLTPHHLHLFDNMVHRMESIAEAAASKVLVLILASAHLAINSDTIQLGFSLRFILCNVHLLQPV